MTTSHNIQSAAVAVARDFLDAFAAQNTSRLRELLDADVVFESPRMTLTGATPVAEAIGTFAAAVREVTVLAAYGDDEHAVVMYDLATGPFGPIRAADHFVVRGGKITRDQLVFDTHPLRTPEAEAPRRPS